MQLRNDNELRDFYVWKGPITDDEIRGISKTYGRDTKFYNILLRKLKGNPVQRVRVSGMIILRWILNRIYGVEYIHVLWNRYSCKTLVSMEIKCQVP
jgi:hypothetical protein